MRCIKFVLDDDNNPVPEPNLNKWAMWMEANHPRHVGWTQITSEVVVSTVFLGVDHNWGDDPRPILFETMVFGGERDNDQYRFHTWDEAAAFHAKIVEELRAK
jgi:hypothetical protein